MTDREFLNNLNNFLNRRLSHYSIDIKGHGTPLHDLYKIQSMIDEFKKMSVVKDNSRVHPNAIIKLSEIKIKQKEMEERTSMEIELVNWNICPKCSGKLDVTFKRWWKNGPWCTKTCQDCGFVTTKERAHLPPCM